MSHPLPRLRAAANPSPERLARAEGFCRIAGVDESGRGPWAGPVVACAVIPPKKRLPVRIDDSKRLTKAQRARAFHSIIESAFVGVGIVPADEIDRLNILQATLLAMRNSVYDLPIVPELVLVDGLAAPNLDMPVKTIVRGDQCSPAIACASIIAKVLRDELMDFYHRLIPRYGFNQHKGYGTTQHLTALTRWGPSVLHRMSFRPVSECLKNKPAPSNERTDKCIKDSLASLFET